MVFPSLPVNIAERDEVQAVCRHSTLLTVLPSLSPPTCCQCVRRVFVWRCFDRQCLCVWAVPAGRRACPVQSWWRAKCSLRVGCAFHSAQPPWTPSRQTAAGGTPLPLSFASSLTYTLHPQPMCFCFSLLTYSSTLLLLSIFLLRLIFSQIKC